MKRYIVFFVAALCWGAIATGCSEPSEYDVEQVGGFVDKSVVGEWRLDVMNGSIVDGFGVYIRFGADGRFELYQQISTGYYEMFDGTFSAADGVLKGRYSDGLEMNTYGYTSGADGNTLILTTQGENPEENIYVRTKIPADLLPAPLSRGDAAMVVRAL